ncbi:MAG: glycosyltransferase family 2 protein [Treponema sp.]|jgi:glycosyltransferase involved in cell wall biosynthesis|nr:glycosyltransferase family 2 protein [Treponema sp.]
MSNEINYSIIIPHKNIPELLKRCLDSIPRRYDIQIIVVDDNSDPCIVNFENLIKLQDSCVEIILTKEGKGAGFAKNTGLKKVKGKWLLIADADDYFNDNFLVHLDNYKNSSYEIVYFGISRINKKIEQENNIDPYYDNLMYNALNYKKYDDYKYKDYNSWGKMLRVSHIMENNIFFDETVVATDRMFSVKNAYYSKNIHFDPNRIYTYFIEQRTDSLTQMKTPKAYYDRLYVYSRMNRFFENISQKKYRINLFSTFIKIINIKEINYTLKALKLLMSKNVPL